MLLWKQCDWLKKNHSFIAVHSEFFLTLCFGAQVKRSAKIRLYRLRYLQVCKNVDDCEHSFLYRDVLRDVKKYIYILFQQWGRVVVNVWNAVTKDEPYQGSLWFSGFAASHKLPWPCVIHLIASLHSFVAAQTPPCAYTESLRESTEFADSHPPDTLVYLAMFWDKLSETVTKIAIRNQVTAAVKAVRCAALCRSRRNNDVLFSKPLCLTWFLLKLCSVRAWILPTERKFACLSNVFAEPILCVYVVVLFMFSMKKIVLKFVSN